MIIYLAVPDNTDKKDGSRLLDIIRSHWTSLKVEHSEDQRAEQCYVTSLNITLAAVNFKDVPKGANEAYSLTASQTGIEIVADHVWGVIRALQTLKQAIVVTQSGMQLPGVPLTIRDAPRYGFRAFLIDTARNPIPVSFILGLVRLMGAFKVRLIAFILCLSICASFILKLI